ncbi:MAG: glutamate synthase, partial [Parasporobacterium sp.]|nr:glutamate synthase [Parasporobacterium sp.]
MNKIYLNNPKSDDVKLKAMMESLIQRAKAVPPGMCPLEAQYTYLQVCISQTCGKCVPCRDGLPQLGRLLKSVLDDEAGSTAAEEIRALAEIIKDSADCAIGYQAADMVLQGLD